MGRAASRNRCRLVHGLIAVVGGIAGPGAGMIQAAEAQGLSSGAGATPLSRQAPVFTYRELTAKLPPPPLAGDDGGPTETSSFSLPAEPRFPAAGSPEDRAQAGLMGRFAEAVAPGPTRAGLTALHPGQEGRAGTGPGPAQTVTATPLGGGRASWYQHAGKTASGGRYDPDRLTAAHHTLPFGTKVKVVNKSNGRSVVVEITDRTNERTKRKRDYAIDLSRASARKLGIAGTGQVALYKVE